MRIRVPPQLLIFALGAAFAMAVPGLPRQHHGPPPIAAGLSFSVSDGAPGWGDRVDALFPVGSSVELLSQHLRDEGFELTRSDDLLNRGHFIYASYQWPLTGECIWQLGVIARSDPGGAILEAADEVRFICSDTGGVWDETARPLFPEPKMRPFEG